MVAALFATGCGGSGGGSGRLVAFILDASSSPLVDSLRDVVEFGAGGSPETSDLIIVDCKAHPPGTLATNSLIANHMAAGKYVMLYDVSDLHGLRDIVPLVNSGHDGSSFAHIIKRSLDRHGRPEYFVYAFPGNPGDALTDLQIRTFAMGAKQFFEKSAASLGSGDGFNPPPGLLYVIFNFFVPPSVTHFTATKNGTDSTNGEQWTSMVPTYQFTLLLNNGTNVTGDFQFVVGKSLVNASPLNSDMGTNKLMITKTGSAFVTCDIGWFQVEVDINMSPQSGIFTALQMKPENANNVTTVNSRINFSVGFTPTTGPSTSFGYTTNDSTELTSWEVVNSSNLSSGAWQYKNQDPWYWDDPSKWDSLDSFGNGVEGFGSFRVPNNLAKDNIQAITKAVWSTQDVVRIIETFNVSAGVTYLNTWAAPFGRIQSGSQSTPTSNQWNIQMQAVLPIPIAAITFAQNPVKASQKSVIGTVTLQSPALVDTQVFLTSNSINATVLSSMKIKQGESSGTFSVDVNGDNLRPRESTVATIQAFNALQQQAQLTVVNE